MYVNLVNPTYSLVVAYISLNGIHIDLKILDNNIQKMLSLTITHYFHHGVGNAPRSVDYVVPDFVKCFCFKGERLVLNN